jgi:AmmeMemoRadiSam system protein B
MAPSLRQPAVVGRFYPQDPERLREDIESYLGSTADAAPAIGCIVPHAGYMYSGHVAGAVFSRIAIPRRTVLLCPNHTGMGHPLSIMSEGAWQTPLGPVPIDSELAETLKQSLPLLTEDSSAHRAEHAAEVELPFLEVRHPGFSFVPIALGTANFEPLAALGEAIAEVVRAQDEPVLIIASSDMNHYESDPITRIKDQKAIEPILRLDARGLYDTVMNEDISMCGFGPTVAMITAARRLGSTHAELIRYATSGDVSGDREMVVGYAGVVVR